MILEEIINYSIGRLTTELNSMYFMQKVSFGNNLKTLPKHIIYEIFPAESPVDRFRETRKTVTTKLLLCILFLFYNSSELYFVNNCFVFIKPTTSVSLL